MVSYLKSLARRSLHLIMATVLANSLASISVQAVAAVDCSNSSLKILLTNDDGYAAPGIAALYQHLNSAGHQVTLIAPESNASGSSASITFNSIQLRKISESDSNNNRHSRRYAIDASPASAVILAVTALYPENEPPDLVISGINKGANLGPATPISGTVGATTAAISQLDIAIPAIAISTDPLGPDPYNPDPKISGVGSVENLQHLDNIAYFITNLVAELGRHRCTTGQLIPEGIALNINYPPLSPKTISGILITAQSSQAYYALSYRPLIDSATASVVSAPDSGVKPQVFVGAFKKLKVDASNLNFDTDAYHAGYITVVPLDANLGPELTKSQNQGFNKVEGSLKTNSHASDALPYSLQNRLTGVNINRQQ